MLYDLVREILRDSYKNIILLSTISMSLSLKSITAGHREHQCSQSSNFIKISLTFVIKEGKSLVSKVSQQCNTFSQGRKVEQYVFKSDNFLFWTTLLQTIEMLENFKFIWRVLEKMPVSSEHTVNLLEC